MAGRYIYTPTCAYGLDRSVCIVREGAAGGTGGIYLQRPPDSKAATVQAGQLWLCLKVPLVMQTRADTMITAGDACRFELQANPTTILLSTKCMHAWMDHVVMDS